MTNFQQAHILLMQQGRWIDGSDTPRFPYTDLDINATVHKVRYGYDHLSMIHGVTTHMVFDNNFVGIHAPAASGAKLKVFEYALDVLMVRRPEYADVISTVWESDGSFRIGYDFNSRMKACSDIEKVFIIFQAMMDTMEAAERFAAWHMTKR